MTEPGKFRVKVNGPDNSNAEIRVGEHDLLCSKIQVTLETEKAPMVIADIYVDEVDIDNVEGCMYVTVGGKRYRLVDPELVEDEMGQFVAVKSELVAGKDLAVD